MEKEDPKYFWTDLQTLVCAIIALVYFFSVIISDVWGAYRKRMYWIPGRFLVLSALTIQALSYLDIASVNLTDEPNIRQVANLLGNHILLDSGRLIICVFMGYLLPGMAGSGSKDQWGDIVALAIGLFSNIASELYFLHRCKYLFNYIHDNFLDYQFDNTFEYDVLSHLQQQPSVQIWYKASSLGIVVSVVFLLLLGSAIPTGSTIREILSQRIAAALTTEGRGKKEVKEFEEVVFKSWLLAHVCRPDYVITRTVMSSAAGMVVTLRILFSLLKLKFLKYKRVIPYDDGLDILRLAVLVLQFLLIFVGWFAIFWGWVTAVVYFTKSAGLKNAFRVENFWRRRIMELRYGWQSQIADLKEEKKIDPTSDEFLLNLKIWLLYIAEKFLPNVLSSLQTLVVYLGKLCWLLSGFVMGNWFFRWCLMRDHSQEFCEYNDVLKRVLMPEETVDLLRIANKKAIKQAEEHMKERNEEGRGCQEMIDFIKDVREPVFQRLEIVEDSLRSLDKMCWMMKAVSYFEIIVILFPDRVDTATKVLDQAADIMNFLDRVDIEEDEKSLLNNLGREADKKFNKLKKGKESTSPAKKPQSISEAKQQIEDLVRGDENNLEKNSNLLVDQGAVDVKKIARSYSFYKVGKYLLQNMGNDVEDLKEMERITEEAFSNLIGYCVLQVKVQLEKKCIEWARGFEVDMLWKAVSIAGKVKGVLEKSKVSLKSVEATNT